MMLERFRGSNLLFNVIFSARNEDTKAKKNQTQKCIPGCVPTAVVDATRCQYRGSLSRRNFTGG